MIESLVLRIICFEVEDAEVVAFFTECLNDQRVRGFRLSRCVNKFSNHVYGKYVDCDARQYRAACENAAYETDDERPEADCLYVQEDNFLAIKGE